MTSVYTDLQKDVQCKYESSDGGSFVRTVRLASVWKSSAGWPASEEILIRVTSAVTKFTRMASVSPYLWGDR